MIVPIRNLSRGRQLILTLMRARRSLATKSIKAMMESKREQGSRKVTKNARLVVMSFLYYGLWQRCHGLSTLCLPGL